MRPRRIRKQHCIAAYSNHHKTDIFASNAVYRTLMSLHDVRNMNAVFINYLSTRGKLRRDRLRSHTRPCYLSYIMTQFNLHMTKRYLSFLLSFSSATAEMLLA